jgi:hypothetical protein
MPSSTSPSDPILERRSPPPGLRLTAADRPGVAQPVPERDIPPRPWGAIALAVLVLTLSLTGLWEWRMRSLGLEPGLPNGPSAWAEQRRRIDNEPVPVAIVGDSRILFDTNLDQFQRLTGVRPVQLALQGTNGLPFLENLAGDPQFKGLVIVGIADLSYFRTRTGLMASALDHAKWESPAQRGSYLVQHALAKHVAMLDPDYRLSTLILRQDPDLRPGVEGPYDDVWKMQQQVEDRQSWLWPRLVPDGPLRDHARHVWLSGPKKPVPPQIIAMTQARTRAAVAKIRARGGEVVFVRPPSAGPFRINEARALPRAKGWDALLAAAQVKGAHFEDMPAAQGLEVPEFSHLTRACARVFTDAYVRRLAELTPRLQIRADAPPPLAAADCVKTEVARN